MLNSIKRKAFEHGVPNSLYYVFTQKYNTLRAQDQFVPKMFLSRSLRNTTIAITTYQEQKHQNFASIKQINKIQNKLQAVKHKVNCKLET
jgi:hypothetical protein